MGGSSGVYYGRRPISDDEKYGDEVLFTFLTSQIDGDQIPNDDDLILNIPDGGFYRVLNTEEDQIFTQRLAISGGGGTSGGGTSNEGSLSINFVTPQRDQILASNPYEIKYEIVATDSAGDSVLNEGIATWRINGKEYTQKVYPGQNSFPVVEYLRTDIAENTCILTVKMDTGGRTESIASKRWYIKVIDLALQWERSYTQGNLIEGPEFSLKWIPYGNIDCTTHIIFDGNMEPGVTYFTKEIKAEDTGKETSLTIPSLPYGTHTAEMYLTTEINGKYEQTPSIKHEITFISGGTTTILTVPFYQTVATQYDTINIPFMVYNPSKEKCKVKFLVNDEEISTDEYNRDLQYWPYTLSNFGNVKLTIADENNETSKDIELIVNKMDLNVSEVSDYKFSLNALKFSSNDELRNWKSNGVNLDFSENFDWINGGLKFEILDDGSVEKYICVRQGTRMTINYNLFENFNSTDTGGKNFKFCFKAINCYDYEAPILDCYEDVSKVGIKFDAQKARFSSLNNQNFITQYYENSYIELETEIWPNVPNISDKIPGDRFLMFWVDGIPAGVKAYETGEKFVQKEPRPIVIGSDLCDVYVYCVKAYDRRLNENEHLNNFIADAPSANKMIERYRRNDILDNKGEISYEKLVKNNPNCHAYMYEVPFMTSSKDDKDTEDLKHCKYTELYGDYNTLNTPYYEADETSIYVQGTSSAAYGIAAFNLRSKFRQGLKDKNGNLVNGWLVSDTALPIDLACTKVNVASCENVNNVVNQEWYNKFQPYHDAHRRKSGNKKYRDTMEFNTGVLFIKDNNTNIKYTADDGSPSRDKYLKANVFSDTVGYSTSPYFKQYAIANMGNDKKNIEVFHDVQNPHACCVEVLDNQNAEHWMTVYNSDAFKKVKINGEDVGPFYEFRYSVKDCKAENKDGVTTETQEADFLRLVQWMSECNPNAYTDEDLPAAVTYGPKEFQGFNPPGYDSSENPSGVSLKGFVVTDYAGTYTKDTYNYRIAKMLDECEDYLIMDSIVYHYLFIERHTMVDNVAKNTFWSTEDGIHWDLTKDYDNDTADGNDNSGYLSFTYGMEFGDKDSTGGEVFNAKNSVWINFIHALKEAQKDLYTKLEAKGAWNADSYLVECKRHQNVIPERCWIYDYFRKYIRPRRLGLDEDTYLKRLEGGKKTYQRAQYEKYQEFYINSKYVASEVFNDSSSINLRLNSLADTWNKENVLPISYYIDCYASLKAGGQLHRSAQRIKRKTKYNIPIGTLLTNPDDGTCYIYGSGMIQTFEGLPDVYPNEADFNPAKKLRILQLGKESSIENPYYNTQLIKVNISSATMLQDAQIQNCGPLNDSGLGMLDLSNTYQLKSLKINGSTFTGLSLAKGSVVESLYLNNLNTIKFEELLNLSEVTFDDGIDNSIVDLTVIKCPYLNDYTYRFAKQSQLLRYQLNDVSWKINDLKDLVVESGQVKSIKVLNNLMNKMPNTNSSTTSLTGKLTIDVDCNIDEYEIYNLYSRTYPNLQISYSDKVSGLDQAVELIFKTDNTDNSNVHYRVLGSGDYDGMPISTLISNDGPLGQAITTPNKESTVSHTYNFTGYWIDKNTNKKYYIPGTFKEDDVIDSSAISFEDIIPLNDMEFYPEYDELDRMYSVKFLDWNNDPVLQNGETTYWVKYNTKYNGPITNFYYRNDNSLKDDERWSFQGWSVYKYGDVKINNPSYTDVTNLVVTGNITLYSHHIKENCKQVATTEEYFNFSPITIDGQSGYSIGIKDIYRKEIKGKITIPTMYNNKNILQVGDFLNTSNITHIYFLVDSKCLSIGDIFVSTTSVNKGFRCSDFDSQLKQIDLPNSVNKIGTYAFTDCFNLESINLPDSIEIIGERAFGCTTDGGKISKMKVSISSLPNSLKTLGAYAFYKGGDNITISQIPDGIEKISNWTFADCPNLRIEEFGVSNSSKLTTIGTAAFWNSGKNVTYVHIGKNVLFLEVSDSRISTSFYGYGSNGTGNLVQLDNDISAYLDKNGNPATSITQLGFEGDRWSISINY